MSDVLDSVPVDLGLLRKMRAGGRLFIHRSAVHAAAWLVDRDGAHFDLSPIVAVATAARGEGVRELPPYPNGSRTRAYTADAPDPVARWTDAQEREFRETADGKAGRPRALRTASEARARDAENARRRREKLATDALERVRIPIRPKKARPLTPTLKPVNDVILERSVVLPPLGELIARKTLTELLGMDQQGFAYHVKAGNVPQPVEPGRPGKSAMHRVDAELVAWLVGRGVTVRHEGDADVPGAIGAPATNGHAEEPAAMEERMTTEEREAIETASFEEEGEQWREPKVEDAPPADGEPAPAESLDAVMLDAGDLIDPERGAESEATERDDLAAVEAAMSSPMVFRTDGGGMSETMARILAYKAVRTVRERVIYWRGYAAALVQNGVPSQKERGEHLHDVMDDIEKALAAGE